MVRAILLTSLFTAAYAARVKQGDEDVFVPGMQPTGGQRLMAKQTVKNGGRVVGTTMAANPNAPSTDLADTSSPTSSVTRPSWRDMLSSHGITSEKGSMQDIAIAALDAHGDAKKLAVFMMDQSPEEMAKFEKMSADVAAKVQSMPGIVPPTGFWDPLGFCTDCSVGKLCFYREVELKHGRAAMLASLGFLVGEKFTPFWGLEPDVPSYIAWKQAPLESFWYAIVAAIAIPEVMSVFDYQNTAEGGERWAMRTDIDRREGDFGFDPLGLKPDDPDELNELQTKELQNGRLAMLGAAGMLAQELVDGQKINLDFR